MSGNPTTFNSDASALRTTNEIFFGRGSEPAPVTDYISIDIRGKVLLRRDNEWIKLTPKVEQDITLDTARSIAAWNYYHEVLPIDTTKMDRSHPEWPQVDVSKVSLPDYKQDSIGVPSKASRVRPESEVDLNPDFKTWNWPSEPRGTPAPGRLGDDVELTSDANTTGESNQ